MSLFDALEAVFDVLEWIAGSMDIEEIVDDATGDSDGPGIPPVVSPAKKAEKYWPTTEKRTDRAPAWPPFSGHRVPLGGGS